MRRADEEGPPPKGDDDSGSRFEVSDTRSRPRRGNGGFGPTTRGTSESSFSLLVLVGLVEAAALAALALVPGHGLPLPGFALWVVAFGAYAIGALLVGANRKGGRRLLTVVWICGIGMRAALLCVPPELTDDVYRYLWDGHVQTQGVNPYRFAPDDVALSSLRTDYHASINNPSIPTIYPPAAQLVFAASSALGLGVRGLGVVWTLFDLLAALFLWRAARTLGRHPEKVLALYLWCPLLIVETAWNAHLEALGLAALAMFLAAHAAGKAGRAGMALGAAGLVKFAPFLLVPAAVRALGRRGTVALIGTTAFLAAPYLGAGRRLWTGLDVYARNWRAHEGLFLLVEHWVTDPIRARFVVAFIVVGAVLWALRRRLTVDRTMLLVFGTALAFSPTFHPWYALWILPAAALTSSTPWIVLQGTAFLAYWGLPTFLDQGFWPQPTWIRFAIWAPPLGLLAGGVIWRRFFAGSDTPHSQ